MLVGTGLRQSAATDRVFFGVMAYAALVVVLAGFATSYYLWPLTRATHHAGGQPVSQSLPLVVHAHAVLFTAWIFVFVTQVTLVLGDRAGVHRRLGSAAAWLVPMMVATGLLTAVRGARDGWNPGGPYQDAFAFMFVGVADLIVFLSLTAAGLALRRRPELHKRCMLLGTLGGLMWPAITRMPIIAGRVPLMFGVLAALVLAPAVRDIVMRSRTWWLTLGVGVGILATFPLRVVVGNSQAWRAFAAWIVQ
jgi:hypothetical protein